MSESLDEIQCAVQTRFRSFADEEVRPAAAGLDRDAAFPAALFRRAGELGYFSMRYPQPDGLGMDVLSYVLATEEIARGSLGVAAVCAMQSLMGTHFVQRYAEGEVRERLLGPALRGERVGAICMTEPDAGSDLLALTTKATRQSKPGAADVWVLSGRKTWVTSAPIADFFTVFARTGTTTLGIFLVEAGAPGLTIGRVLEKSGVRPSPTCEVFFEDVPATCALGDPVGGIASLREVLAHIRVMTAALAVGIAQAALDDTLRYAGERRQFGKAIGSFQLVQAHLADMAVDVQAARQLTHWAARRSDRGLENTQESSMAKLFASEAALRVCDHAARVFASYGFSTEYPIERYLRDVRFTLIGGGTSEILRVNIARGLTP